MMIKKLNVCRFVLYFLCHISDVKRLNCIFIPALSAMVTAASYSEWVYKPVIKVVCMLLSTMCALCGE